MKVDGTLAALTRFDLQRSEDHRVDPVLPENLGVVHAWRGWNSIKRGHPRFAARHEEWRAVCGWRVKVVLPVPFDTAEPEACERCVRAVLEDARDPAANGSA